MRGLGLIFDIKKVLNWYSMLQAKGMVSKEEPKIENAEEVKEQVEEFKKLLS